MCAFANICVCARACAHVDDRIFLYISSVYMYIQEDGSDSEIATRVEEVEEELRSLVQEKRQRDEKMEEHITHALSLAQRIGSGIRFSLDSYAHTPIC
jgi:hypothetical protein